LGKTLEEGETRKEDSTDRLTVNGEVRQGKNHTAEETANGKVGLPNQYGRHLDGFKTLDEQPIP
jgi:hypothetical protein